MGYCLETNSVKHQSCYSFEYEAKHDEHIWKSYTMFVIYRIEGESKNHRKQESSFSQRIEVDYRHRSDFPGLLTLCVYVILVGNDFALKVTKALWKGHTHVQLLGYKKCCGRLLIDLHRGINSLGIVLAGQSHQKVMVKIASRIQADAQD